MEQMRRLQLATVLCLALCVSPCFAFSEQRPSDPRILVLLDDLGIKSSHSIFFKSLQDRGYDLDFRTAKDSTLALQKYGEYLYDAAIIFAPKANAFGGSLDLNSFLDFVDAGHDLILAVDSGVSDIVRDIALECGVDVEEASDALVIDHKNFLDTPGRYDPALITAADVINSTVILGSNELPGPVVFKGVALSVSPNSNLVFPILSASPTAYSASPSAPLGSVPNLQGSAITLVAAVQARNNARVIVSGSLALFSDQFFRIPLGTAPPLSQSGNAQFAVEVAKWAFHERGHVKAFNLTHHLAGETSEPAVYRISDHLDFSVGILEWSGKEWVPFVADDVQVQFFMMSPYVLKTLSQDGKGHFFTTFQVPDVYGVFQFKLQYHRLGYSAIDLAKQIPVRPFRHDEFERFIGSAYPYYASAFSMMFGFFIFGFIFLYHK